MSCPTCSKTMCHAADRLWWCEVCGTIVTHYTTRVVSAPKLVGRCRAFARRLSVDQDAMLVGRWHGLGIGEAISTEDERGGTADE